MLQILLGSLNNGKMLAYCAARSTKRNVFAGLTNMTNRHTVMHTDRPRYFVCRNRQQNRHTCDAA